MGDNARTAAVGSGDSVKNAHAEQETRLKNANIREQLHRGSRRRRLALYALTAASALVMVILVFLSRGVYPYGDVVLRYIDGQQYFSFLGQLQRALMTDENVLFSWSTVLGGNAIGFFAYYAASPFNLLTVFFPDDLMTAYHVIFTLKFVAAAVCFAVMLRNMFEETSSGPILLFSVSYPFMGFMTHYAWNQSWMDAIILMPLVFLGIWQIVHYRNPIVYAVALSLTLLANYYTGYMVCIGSALLFVTALIVSRPKSAKDAIQTCAWYIASTALAAALAAWLLLPTYDALPENRSKPLRELMDSIEYRSTLEETVSMLFTAPYRDMTWADNYPVIFTGIVQLVLVVLFFLNDEISTRSKVAAAALVTVFGVSFAFSTLNIIWHGFSNNIWYNYRYSFLVSFVLECIAFYSFIHVHRARTKLLLAGGLLAGVTLIALRSAKENIGPVTLLLDVTMIYTTLALLRAYSIAKTDRRHNRQRVLFAAIAGVVACNLLVNAYLSLEPIKKDDTMSAYRTATQIDAEIAACIDDDGFYRMGSTWRYGVCDPARAGYAGVENYASPERPEVIDAVSKLGLGTKSSKADYDDNVPLSTDALLGLRYVVTENEHKAERYAEAGQVADADLRIYENPFALPVLFPGDSLYSTASSQELNKFEHMKEYWNSISTEGGDVFRPVAVQREDVSTDNGHDIRLSFTAVDGGPVYAYIPRGDVIFDAPMEAADDTHRDIYYVGEYVAGEHGELILHAGSSYDPGDDIVFYSENVEALAAKTSEVLSHGVQIERKSGSELTVQYTADEDGFVTSTIPFDQGWHVYVDGTEVETYRNMDTFLTFDVSRGDHEIQLIYWPPYFGAGVAISTSAVAVLLAYAHAKRRKQSALTVETASDVRGVRQ